MFYRRVSLWVTRHARVFPFLLIASSCVFVATDADAAITFRAASSANVADGDITAAIGTFAERTTCGSINPSIPAGNVGDLLVAQVVARRNTSVVTMPGWSTMYSDNVAGTNYQVFLFYRSATNTAADTTTTTQSGTCNHLIGRIARFGNVDTAQLFDFNVGSAVYSNAGDVDTGTQVVNVANSLLVLATFVADDRTVTQPATFTQLYDIADNSGGDAGMSLNYRLETATGTKGPFLNMDLARGGNDPNHGLLFVVRPKSLTINMPVGTVANDVMIASVTVRACSNASGAACTLTVAAPAGWAPVDTVDQTAGAGTDGFGNRLLVYSRVATGAEPASYSWTFGGTPVHAGAAGGILSFAGVDTVNPIVDSAGQSTAASYNHTAPSIDTGTVTNTMMVSTHSVNSSGTWTAPAGMTERVDIASFTPTDDLGLSIEMNHELRAAAGATGTRTATLSNPPTNDTGATHMLALRPATLVDHYAVSHSGNGLTCAAEPVTITAHDAAHAAVVPGNTTTIRVSVSTAHGTWSLITGTGTLTNISPGVADYTFNNESQVVLGLANTFAETANLTVSDGSVTDVSGNNSPVENSSLTFAHAGFRVVTSNLTPAVITPKIAGKDSATVPEGQALYLQAVKTDLSNFACTNVFPPNTSVTAGMAFQCNNPSTCIGGQNATITNYAPAPVTTPNVAMVNAAPVIPTTYTSVPLYFGANAFARFRFTYPDAGLISIHARYTLSPSNENMVGASNPFVVKPAGFIFSNIIRTSDSFANPVAADANGQWFIGAGEAFTATVKAVANDGVNATPNFGREATPEGVLLSQTLSAPAGGSSGTLSNATIAGGEFGAGGVVNDPNGSATVTNLSWSEVGIIRLAGQIADNDYLGGGTVPNSYSSVNIGRFSPTQYAVTASSITPACTTTPPGFTYARQPFSGTITIEAQNAVGNLTANFRDGFDKLVPNDDLTFVNDQTVAAYDDKLIGFVAGQTFSDAPTGRANLDLRFRWDMPQQAPVDTTVQLIAASGEVTTVVGAPVNVGVTNMRLGRLALENAFGSELLPLPLPLVAEYYVGANTGFVTNGDDGCTAVSSARLDLSNDIADPPLGTPSITTDSGPPAATTTVNVGNNPIAAGVGGLTFSAPGDGGDGYVDVSANLAGLDWLRFDWDGDGANDDDPSARATFGIYKGSPRQIYLRERY